MGDNSVLLLNFDQSPLNIIPMKRALDLMTKNKVYYETDTTKCIKIKALAGEIIIPKVLILKYYVKIPNKKSFPSKKNILRRDKYTCQYCSLDLTDKEATVDHIVPRHRGGGNSWVNLVACCRDCNLFKGNRTPKEAGMELLRKPKEPTHNLIFEDVIRFYMRK
jgi:5-methylcytosine-specific restriction endonuclease McrA